MDLKNCIATKGGNAVLNDSTKKRLDTIFVNLKVVSKIKENGRINTTSTGSVIALEYRGGGWQILQSILRFLTSDSRKKAYNYINGLITDAIEESDKMILNNDKDHLERMYIELKGSIRGISNLKTTYGDDARYESRFERIIEKIDEHIKKIERLIC